VANVISPKNIRVRNQNYRIISETVTMAMKRENEKLPGIDESYRLLTFEYAFRQVGFIVLLGIIVAAIAGLFSSGMVSDTVKTNSAKSLTINYERFGRRETETRMQLAFPVKTEGPIPSASPARAAMRMIQAASGRSRTPCSATEKPLFCLSQPEKDRQLFGITLYHTVPSR
jgi:hypothetical protein